MWDLQIQSGVNGHTVPKLKDSACIRYSTQQDLFLWFCWMMLQLWTVTVMNSYGQWSGNTWRHEEELPNCLASVIWHLVRHTKNTANLLTIDISTTWFMVLFQPWFDLVRSSFSQTRCHFRKVNIWSQKSKLTLICLHLMKAFCFFNFWVNLQRNWKWLCSSFFSRRGHVPI